MNRIGLKVIAAMIFSSGALFAQDEDTASKPFFFSKKFESTAYVQTGVNVTHMVGSAAATTHFSLHWVVNRKFVVGANYHVLSSREEVKKLTYPEFDKDIFLTHHFAGLSFGYILFSDKKFSLHPELSAGWSNIKFTRDDSLVTRKHFAGIVPSVSATWNATKFFRLGVGVNYRLIVGEPFKELNTRNLSGVGGMIFMRFGRF